MKQAIYQRIAVYALVALGGLTMVLPFIWMLSTSLKTTTQSMAFPPEWIPEPFVWENYTRIADYMPFFLFLYNSVKIAFFVVFGTLLTCSLAGYAFAKLRFPGRKPLFLVLVRDPTISPGNPLEPHQRVRVHHAMEPFFPALFSHLAWPSPRVRLKAVTTPQVYARVLGIKSLPRSNPYWSEIDNELLRGLWVQACPPLSHLVQGTHFLRGPVQGLLEKAL